MKNKAVRKIVFKRLIRMKANLIIAAVSMLGFTVCELLSPWPLKLIFDQVLLKKPLDLNFPVLHDLLNGDQILALLVLSSGIVVIALLRGLFSYSQIFQTSRIGYRITYTLRRKLFSHLQQLSLSYHTQVKSGELMTKITSDTNALRDVFAESALTFSAHVLTVIGMFGVMIWVNWRLSLVALIIFPIICFALYILFRKVRRAARDQRKREGSIASRTQERLSAISIIQAFGRERYEKERFVTESNLTLENSIRTARLEAVATRTVEILSSLGVWAVVLFGSLEVLKNHMAPGEVLVFINYVTNMNRPLRNLAKLLTKFSKAGVSAERINEILSAEPEIKDSPDALIAAGVTGAIVFDHVSFEYNNDKKVLDDISFSIRSGERIALVGGSGAGKSTITNLILRLYDPSGGRILLDGLDLRNYQRESLREHIAIVLQGSVLFGASIRENIAYGRPDATETEVIAAALAANAHDFIMALEDGYDTVIGERGSTLSGGQRQRISIARALIRNARILILDEPMTGLDAGSEALVSEALDHLMQGKTCIIITHDMEAAAKVDTVYLLENGKIRKADQEIRPDIEINQAKSA
jgi:ATP-binding cassette subfamily B protein/subfamily B ATP-binding cassette protein MsbA